MNTNTMPLPMDISLTHEVITNKKYVCDNCHNAYITSQDEGDLPAECPFCNASISCGSLDISFNS